MIGLRESSLGKYIVAESGSPGEFHLQAPTDPCVNLSIHTAPTSHTLETSRLQAGTERSPVPPSCLVDHLFLQAGSSPFAQLRTFYIKMRSWRTKWRLFTPWHNCRCHLIETIKKKEPPPPSEMIFIADNYIKSST